MAFDGICPAATIECGLLGDPSGIEHACRYLEDLLTLDAQPDQQSNRHALHLVESHLSLNIPEHTSFAFDPTADVDLLFDPDFEDRNFTLIDPHEVFGYTRVERSIVITDSDNLDVTDEIVRIEEGRIFLNNTMMPAMITRDQLVVRQGSLCHLKQDYLHQQMDF